MALPFETGGMHWMVEVNGKTYDFCTPPRCGSQSTLKGLRPLGPIPWHPNADVKINMVRHPVSRFVSAFMVRGGHHGCHGNFDAFVDFVTANPNHSDPHMRPQVEFWSPDPDYFLLLEHIDGDWAAFVELENFPIEKFPHKHASGNNKPVPTPKQTVLLEKFYAKDLHVWMENVYWR